MIGRTQCVFVEGARSRLEPVISGVPQGSVLGPLLFLIMLRDIDHNVHTAFVSSFADDTCVLGGIAGVDDVAALQRDLEIIYQWSETNNAQFNSGKFELLRYGYNTSYYN